MGWTSEELLFTSGLEQEILLPPKSPDHLWAHSPSYSIGKWGCYPKGQSGQGVKLTNVCSHPGPPSHAFMAWCLITHMDTLYFLLLTLPTPYI